jgi:hypothetical protein
MGPTTNRMRLRPAAFSWILLRSEGMLINLYRPEIYNLTLALPSQLALARGFHH